jgi:minor extracellular serine protease Vpr
MKNLLTLALLAAITYLQAQVAIMPAHTHAAIEVIQRELNQNRSVVSQEVMDFYPIYADKGQYQIAVMCKVNDAFKGDNAVRDGYDVGTVIGPIVTMRMPLSKLVEGFSYPGIEYLEVAEKMAPNLDEAIKDVQADKVHKGIDLPQSYTGKNVLIGVVDWGFDYTHPMFYDTLLDHSRIAAAWDQVKKTGTPPPGFSHGAWYNGPDELAAAQHDTLSPLTDYHGTHVAGIAGGSGGGTKYRGMGFESNLLFSQMRNDVTSAIDAFQWMYNVSQATGKRLVINNSWGNYRLFPLDGTSLMSQAIDAFSDLGVVFVFSAGNNGDINFHLKKSFAADSVKTRIMGFDYVNDKDLWGQSVGMWGEPGNAFSVQLRILNEANELLVQSDLINTATAAAYQDTYLITGTDTIFYHVTTDAAHPLNGRPQMTLDIRNKNAALKKILYAQAPSGTVHCWNTRLTTYGIGNWGYGFTAPKAGYVNGDKNYGIGHPAVTNSVITTAAHQTNFHLTNFSSYGPRMDDVLKPDISAPGQDIISSMNSFSATNFTPVTKTTFNGKEYEFVRLSGTSMSAPMVAGAVALILEAAPDHSSALVKWLLINTAREDNLTGDLPSEGHVRWGHGKLDVFSAIQLITVNGISTISESKDYAFPNPAKDIIYVTKPLTGHETYRLLSLDGRLMRAGQFDGALHVEAIPDGMYFLTIEDESGIESFRIVIAR